jgi:AcrR family transcriptional regulator
MDRKQIKYEKKRTMPTPRKKYKLRDPERTRNELLETIADIMKTTGHTGLRVNQVARRMGKDKGLIRYYYGSLTELQKAYIRETDYWAPFFERFLLSENPDKDEIRTLFTEMMQQNFLSFIGNPEMQKIILWQISEISPLMRSVSDSRERDGAELLEKVVPHFVKTGVSFKSVLAILLGGIYYLGLHAANNKSTVCGIDINIERDRDKILDAIGQIIGWACDAANKEGG